MAANGSKGSLGETLGTRRPNKKDREPQETNKLEESRRKTGNCLGPQLSEWTTCFTMSHREH